MNFEELCELEPRLYDLRKVIAWIKDDGSTPHFCANEVWEYVIKPLCRPLVGWDAVGAPDARLQTTYAWDTVTDEFYEMLPACRECGCL